MLFGHESSCDYVLYKDRPIPEWYLDDAGIHLPPEGDDLDPINELVLRGPSSIGAAFPGGGV